MGLDRTTTEVVRRRFPHGDPAMPLRHTAREALLEELGEADSTTLLGDVLVVISELVQNVTQHTDGDGELIVSLVTGSVLVEVGDTDPAFPLPKAADPLGDGGRGLRLIAALARDWGVRTCPRGKVVWAQLS
jgi:hypothetical protein